MQTDWLRCEEISNVLFWWWSGVPLGDARGGKKSSTAENWRQTNHQIMCVRASCCGVTASCSCLPSDTNYMVCKYKTGILFNDSIPVTLFLPWSRWDCLACLCWCNRGSCSLCVTFSKPWPLMCLCIQLDRGHYPDCAHLLIAVVKLVPAVHLLWA